MIRSTHPKNSVSFENLGDSNHEYEENDIQELSLQITDGW